MTDQHGRYTLVTGLINQHGGAIVKGIFLILFEIVENITNTGKFDIAMMLEILSCMGGAIGVRGVPGPPILGPWAHLPNINSAQRCIADKTQGNSNLLAIWVLIKSVSRQAGVVHPTNNFL